MGGIDMSSICPQRILREAIRLLEECGAGPHSDPGDFEESIDNSIMEMRMLINRLDKAGITKINEKGEHN